MHAGYCLWSCLLAVSDPSHRLLQLSLAHLTAQALRAAVEMGLPAALLRQPRCVEDLEEQLSLIVVNDGVLPRLLRLLAAEGLVTESVDENGQATYASTLLLEQAGRLKPVLDYWLQGPLWTASVLMHRKNDLVTPLEQATGLPLEEYYQQHPQELANANAAAKALSDLELEAVVSGYDWSSLKGKTLVDLGGYRGATLSAIVERFPDIQCLCVDQASAIEGADPPDKVELVAGNVFDAKTLPSTDAILMKHMVLCEFDFDDSIRILRACTQKLPIDGVIIVAEAILPNVGKATDDVLACAADVLLMLGGRESPSTRREWIELAQSAGLTIDSITSTAIPTCSIIVMSKQR